ncbi:MAG: SDR family NAD(P)-dependent oxidoreductase [Ardenticatenia bacterium]|nr:SDR family NAD(P)-dependent oxidoreductase [Ardenticatenia bacterium]
MNRPVVMVTGASRGIGAATARWLGRAGATVVVVARTEPALRRTAEEVERLGGRALALAGDVSDAEFCHRVVDQAVTTFGHLDALVNNAAVLEPIARVAEADVVAWRYAVEVNLVAPFFLTREALPALRAARGRLINISSGAAHHPIAAWSAYCATKAGLHLFTQVVALEEPQVIAISVHPGVVDTEMQALIRRRGEGHMFPEQVARFRQLKERGELVSPELSGRSIAWLALHAPSTMSGRFVAFDDADVLGPAKRAFGEPVA